MYRYRKGERASWMPSIDSKELSMTEREICEYIVKKKGYCFGISCTGNSPSLNEGTECPLYVGGYNCEFGDTLLQAKRWLEAHPSECKYCPMCGRKL